MIIKRQLIKLNGKKVGGSMEFRKQLAVFFMVLIILTFSTSCMLLEESLMTPYPEISQTDVPVQSETPFVEGPKVDWLLTAQGLGATVGDRITLRLPPNGSASRVWGTGLYTADSSIGTAAVHMGLITFASGGEVTIEIQEGHSSYVGSIRNDVESTSYGVWGLSFAFIDRDGRIISTYKEISATPVTASVPVVSVVTPVEQSETVSVVDWNTNAQGYEEFIGSRYSYTLPPDGLPGRVWGTDLYTSDSSIGTAAVHAGLISFATGGTVTIEIVEGQSSYEGSVRNGVETTSYGQWGGSYVFIDGSGNVVKPMASVAKATQIADANWSTSSQGYEQFIGSRYSYTLPPDGLPGRVWGTDLYTSDSSIGTAAVHAGLISFATGGTVTIEIVEGQSSYEGSMRNGVETTSYGQWGSSFKFVR